MAGRVWTVKDALDWTVGFLETKGDEQPRISAEWLISAATGLSRVEVYAYHDRPLTEEERDHLRDGVKRRAEGQPLQYITGEMPFRHIIVHVEPGVFIPRPETETLVQVGIDHLAKREISAPKVLDICTGSGCIACAVASELDGSAVVATDLNPAAVRVATFNAERTGSADRLSVYEGDLFEPIDPRLKGGVDLVLSNPPYVPSSDLPDLPEEVLGFEPHLALDGGPDGLDTARRIIEGAVEWLRSGALLALELDERYVKDAVNAMEPWYEDRYIAKDLTGRDRIAAGVRK